MKVSLIIKVNHHGRYRRSYVKEWEKHNKDRVKELKPLIRKASGKEERDLRRELFNREGYLKSIVTYFDTSTWLDLFYGKDQEHKIKWRTVVPAYDKEGFVKIENWRIVEVLDNP